MGTPIHRDNGNPDYLGLVLHYNVPSGGLEGSCGRATVWHYHVVITLHDGWKLVVVYDYSNLSPATVEATVGNFQESWSGSTCEIFIKTSAHMPIKQTGWIDPQDSIFTQLFCKPTARMCNVGDRGQNTHFDVFLRRGVGLCANPAW